MHVMLEIDAPVYQTPQAYEANGLVTGNGGVDHVAECSSCLACSCRDGEDSNLSDVFRASADPAKADWLTLVFFTSAYIFEVRRVSKVNEGTCVKFRYGAFPVLLCFA